jgi:hypothetical protein
MRPSTILISLAAAISAAPLNTTGPPPLPAPPAQVTELIDSLPIVGAFAGAAKRELPPPVDPIVGEVIEGLPIVGGSGGESSKRDLPPPAGEIVGEVTEEFGDLPIMGEVVENLPVDDGAAPAGKRQAPPPPSGASGLPPLPLGELVGFTERLPVDVSVDVDLPVSIYASRVLGLS